MAQTIRRGGKGVRRAAATRTTQAKVARAKQTTGSALDRAMGALPVSEARLHQVFLAAILGGAVVLAWMVASFAGVPAMASAQLAFLARDAGFEVRRVEVRGVKRMQSRLADRQRAHRPVERRAGGLPGLGHLGLRGPRRGGAPNALAAAPDRLRHQPPFAPVCCP